ncbi:discoidin domain-containing protein [Brevibacillus sp. 1238]|uniref:discoidin domain-containing protein n=1 Tax=Brevibacillus sp. 1238 TaxID=2940565 RepID=UPI0024753305|nr:discoidin domain-containing protein [Brevibacillus sp. 1238]MDH6353650.1 hypothetical protein [Brevibacillus sp. 1238]
MLLATKRNLLLISFGLIVSILFSGQNTAHAEDQYTNDLIPAMTSNNSPSGLASASTEWSSNHKAYRAFNDVDDTYGWYTSGTTLGWLQYEFPSPQVISKYTITSREYMKGESPKDWTFEAFNGSEWIILDQQVNITGWAPNLKKEFVFTNNTAFTQYRLNITANNGYSAYTGIEEMEMMAKVKVVPDPGTDPGTDPGPSEKNALLAIKMISGLEKEFDLTAAEIEDFIDWYNRRADGQGKEIYMFEKNFNKGPFTSRKDYVAFSKIQSFEVMEYSK